MTALAALRHRALNIGPTTVAGAVAVQVYCTELSGRGHDWPDDLVDYNAGRY